VVSRIRLRLPALILVAFAVAGIFAVPVMAAPVPSCGTCHATGRTLQIVGLHDAHSQRLASQIASALADQPVTLDQDSINDLADEIASRGVTITAMPDVSLDSSVSIEGTIPAQVIGIGAVDSGGMVVLLAVVALSCGVVVYRALVP